MSSRSNAKPRETLGVAGAELDEAFKHSCNEPDAKCSAGPGMHACPSPEMYRSVLGKFHYLGKVSRPDLVFMLGKLSRYQQDPRQALWDALMHVVDYVTTTRSWTLPLGGGELGRAVIKRDVHVSVYTDADYADNKLTRRSTSCVLVQLGGSYIRQPCKEVPNNVYWSSTLQPTVALNTAEAELVGMSEGTRDARFVRHLMVELGLMQSSLPVKLYGDNQAALSVASNPESFSKTKHMEIKYLHIRDLVEVGQMVVEYCPTEEMVADGLTKLLGRNLHRESASRLLDTGC